MMRLARCQRLACHFALLLAQASPSAAQTAPADVAASPAPETPVAAEPALDGKLRARAAFESGKRNLASGDLPEAVRNFKVAYEFHPNYSVLFNLGQALALLDRPVEAKDALERYLRDGGSKIPADRRARVELLLERQRQHIGFVVVQARQADIDLFIDGNLIGKTPLEKPLELAFGPHTLVAKAEGFEPSVETLQVTTTALLTLVVDLSPRAPPEPQPPRAVAPSILTSEASREGPLSANQRAPLVLAPLPEAPAKQRKTPWPWIAGVSGVLLETTAVSLYVWNGHRFDQWQRDRLAVDAKLRLAPDDASTFRDRKELYDRAASIQRVDDVALSAALLGAAALVTGAVQWLTR